jgi:hypothetical protein
MRNTKKKKVKIFSILKIDDEYSVIHYPYDRLRLDPWAVSPDQSGVTTTPTNEVTFNHTSTKYSKYLTTSSTSFYASRSRFPTETQLKRAIMK